MELLAAAEARVDKAAMIADHPSRYDTKQRDAWNAHAAAIAERDALAALIAERDELRVALDDLMSWFPEKPSSPEWRFKAGEHGADAAVEAARAVLSTNAQGVNSNGND